jgi:DNA recombination protein RmuC
MSGLRPGIDFVEQSGARDAQGAGRPDVVVRLPSGVQVVIDAKVPLDRYLQACDTEEPAQERQLLTEHARAVHEHVVALSRRNYADLVGGPVEFVAMFLPKESFLDAAIAHRPAILEAAQAHGIVLVTPSTVHGLLHTVASLWKEHRLAEAASDVQMAGEELYARISVFLDHFAKVGRTLGGAVNAYNEATGSLEARVLPSARRLEAMGIGRSKTLRLIDPVDECVRDLRAAERGSTGPQPGGQVNVTSIGAASPLPAVNSTETVPPVPLSSTSVPVSESNGDW